MRPSTLSIGKLFFLAFTKEALIASTTNRIKPVAVFRAISA